MTVAALPFGGGASRHRHTPQTLRGGLGDTIVPPSRELASRQELRQEGAQISWHTISYGNFNFGESGLRLLENEPTVPAEQAHTTRGPRALELKPLNKTKG